MAANKESARSGNRGKRETQADRFNRIYKTLRERISLLEYPPGTVLNEGLLSREFGVSRTPVRSVLQRLGYEGLVTTRNGIGTIVTESDVKTFREVYALRMRLAEDLGVLSPVTPKPEVLEALRDLRKRARKLTRAGTDYKAYARLCNALHEQLLELSGNAALREITDLLYYRTSRMWLTFLPESDWKEQVTALENEITDTIRALELEDMQGVGQVRRRYLYRVLKTIGRYITGD